MSRVVLVLCVLAANASAQVMNHDRAVGPTHKGLREGPWQFWRDVDTLDRQGRPSEEPVARGAYLHGKKHGRWTFWYSKNHKSAEIECRKGKPHGAYRTWHDNDRPWLTGRYVDGAMDGVWRDAPSDRGGISAVGVYKRGKRVSGVTIDLCSADSCEEGDSGLLLCMPSGDDGEVWNH